MEDTVKGKKREDRLRIWIKVEQVGWRIEGEKENLEPSKQGEERSAITPVSLLRVFSNLSVQDNQPKNRLLWCIGETQEETTQVQEEEVLKGGKLGGDGQNSNLIEMGDNDIMTVRCNGITFQSRVGDLNTTTTASGGQKVINQKEQVRVEEMVFSSGVVEGSKSMKKMKLKKIVRGCDKSNRNISGAKRRTSAGMEDKN